MGVVVVVVVDEKEGNVDGGAWWGDGWGMDAETTAASGGSDRDEDDGSAVVVVVEVAPAVGGRLASRDEGRVKLKVELLEEMGRKDCCWWLKNGEDEAGGTRKDWLESRKE